MRILKGLSSKFLACGCVAGVYETYDGLIIAVIDVPGSACDNDRHGRGKVVPVSNNAADAPSQIRSTSSNPR
jgi:hypothetical protein